MIHLLFDHRLDGLGALVLALAGAFPPGLAFADNA